ncbi:hypothetical protein OG429_20020 [Streptomyces sp. NBC_00190]|uniref:hypothetical protein n=1 Tax=unclassified Streptomyces TaxID=2593676 RepID=UPI002E29FE3A|nr:hypothetical protein [Streptomyces sp. NBC_00190]WSZ41357.1 hypothetical protein OG239_22805 [Streptomyces sp. NBC_00868]
MIQGFRPPRRLARAVLTAAAFAAVGPVYAVPALAVPVFTTAALTAPALAVPALVVPVLTDPAPVLDDVPDAVREGLAGSAAGSGRERPGRPATEPANPEMLVASRPLPVRPPRLHPPALPDPPQVAPTPPEAVVRAIGTEPNDRAADLAAHILPLGTGFALMGLGLGYLGVRLRRGL